MATQLALDETTGTDIVAAVDAKPAIVLLDTEKFDVFYEALKAKAPTDADVSTKKGRDALRSFAADVRSEKAKINRDRLRLTKEWRDLTSQVNDAGKQIDERLESLAVEVRQPLTEWEEAEKAREARVDAAIIGMQEYAKVSIDDTSATVRERGSAVYAMVLDADEFGDRLAEAEHVKASAIETLKSALVRLTKEEADRAELEKLRAEQAEREASEAAEREAKERNEAKRAWARKIISYIKDEVGKGTIGGKSYPYIILIRELEEKINVTEEEFGDMASDVETARRETLHHVREAQKEQAERSRREAAEQAAQEAREEEQRKAEAEQARKDAQAQAKIDEANARAAEAERLAQAERDRVAEQERRRAQQEAADRAEQERREKNRQHVGNVMREAKEAIMTCGVGEEVAKAIVLAIKANTIPHVGITF